MDEKRITALEREVQELQKEIKAVKRNGLLNSISIFLLAVGSGIGFWRVYEALIRISENVRDALKLIGDQAISLSVVLQQINDFLAGFIELYQRGVSG